MTAPRDFSRGYVGDGFEILSPISGSQTFRLERWSPEAESVLRYSQAQRIIIDRFWKGPGSDLDFLRAFSAQITRVEISTDRITDLSALEDLRNLETLVVECAVDSLDFSKLSKLRSCLLAPPADLGNVRDCQTLTELALFELSVRDLTGIRSLPELRRLHLNQLRELTSLDGVQSLRLERVKLTDLIKLQSLTPLGSVGTLRALEVIASRGITDLSDISAISSLESLAIVGAPALSSLAFLEPLGNLTELGIWNTEIRGKEARFQSLTPLHRLRVLKLISVGTRLRDFDALGQLGALEVLFLDRFAEIPSLGFLRDLKRLRELALSRTEIGDGDLGLLLELPRLERILRLSPHKKHYTHTLEQLDAILEQRHPDRAASRAPDHLTSVIERSLSPRTQAEDAEASRRESLAEIQKEELIRYFGSWNALHRAITDELQKRAKHRQVRGRFSEHLVLGGIGITVTGRLLRGRLTIELIEFDSGAHQ